MMVLTMAVTLVSCLILTLTSEFMISGLAGNTTQTYADTATEGYKTEIKSQVQASIAVVQGFYDQYKAGTYTEQQAKDLAKETVRQMRYRDDGSGYMWIDDTDYTLVMHPILKENEGTNRYELADQNGVKIIQNIMKSAQDGGGYNSFYFTKADGVTVAEKLAYSQEFTPWKWVITTGNYIDDMDAQMAAQAQATKKEFNQVAIALVAETAGIVLIAAVLSYFLAKLVSGAIRKVEKNLVKIADGDLTFTISDKLLNRSDEVGEMTRSLKRVMDNLRRVAGGLRDSSTQMYQNTVDFSDRFTEIRENINNIDVAIEEMAQGSTTQAQETTNASGRVSAMGDAVDVEKMSVDELTSSSTDMMQNSEEAKRTFEELMVITDKTQKAVGEVTEQTRQTNVSAEGIKAAVNIITDIASQTSLLSLNASIEAARAGEAGRGFAVVAEQIGQLAQQSDTSARQIETIVQELMHNSAVTVENMNEVVDNTKEQAEKLNATKLVFDSLTTGVDSVTDVSDKIQSQAAALEKLKEEISDMVNTLASISEENAASCEETSASMQVLNDTINTCTNDTNQLVEMSEMLQKLAGHFKLE